MVTVARYLLKWCSIDDSLRKHHWIDFISRFNHSFESVVYFAEIFPLLKAIDKEKLQSQFLNYLTLANEDLPKTLQHPIATSEVGHCPVDEY